MFFHFIYTFFFLSFFFWTFLKETHLFNAKEWQSKFLVGLPAWARGNESLSSAKNVTISRFSLEIAFWKDLCGELKTKLGVIYGNWRSRAPLLRAVQWARGGSSLRYYMICLISKTKSVNNLHLSSLCSTLY